MTTTYCPLYGPARQNGGSTTVDELDRQRLGALVKLALALAVAALIVAALV